MPLAASRPHALPTALEPQLCTLVREIAEADSWLHEIEYDGWRLLARRHGELVYLDAQGFPRVEPLLACVRQSDEARVYYQIWDMPWQTGRSGITHPLLERKQALADLLSDPPSRLRAVHRSRSEQRRSLSRDVRVV